MNTPIPSKEAVPKRAGHRLGFLAGVAILVAGALALVHLQPELETNLKVWATLAIALVGSVLALIWFVFLSRLRWSLRLAGLGILAVAVFGVRQVFRIDGTVNGTGWPRWVLKGSEDADRRDLSKAAEPVGTGGGGDTVTTNAVEVIPMGLADTPQFLGPRRDGVLRGSNLARDWSTTPPRELWRQPVGGGWSSFAVLGARAFTQEQRGEDEWVSCYEALTGRLIWAQTNHARFFQWQGGEGPRATPTVDRGRVFAIGGTGVLDCLEASTGRRIWTRDVLVENGLPNLTWGVSCSPLLVDDAVIVTGGAAARATLVAYHRETGAPLWQSGTDKPSYASPVVATLAGKRLVLSVNMSSLTGHDPASGTVLLDVPWSPGDRPKASQPVVLEGDRVFLSAGYGMGCVMLQVKADPDPNADGRLTTEELWRNRMMKTQFNSAAYRDGNLFGLDDGLLACVDAATGERRWKDGRFGSGQSLIVDDLVLIQSERGPVVLAAADPEGFRELGRLPALDGKTWNYPTLAGRYLLVRNDREAACYELPVK
ncbi:MAG: PQQ-binding-like beta-propeller repeat protein [Limisphaerales bacterium]